MQLPFDHPRHGALWAIIEPDLPHCDIAHDSAHVLRVTWWALRLASESGADPDLVGAAALVHDLVNIPKDSSERSLGSERSAQASLLPLAEAGYDAAEISVIAEAVRTCSWSRGLAPTNAEGTALQDADRLDAIGALGIARCFATAQAMVHNGSPGSFYHSTDPAGRSDRDLDDKRWAADHYPIKLLRLAATMHTRTAREEAARRHAFLVAFLDELALEVPPPAG